MTKRKVSPATITVLAVFSASQISARPARLEPLKPTRLDAEGFAESFVAMADLDDGTFVKVQLGTSNAGPGDGRGACRLLIVPKGRKSKAKSKVYSSDEWSYNHSNIQMGACSASAGRTLKFLANLDGVAIELELQADIRSSRKEVMAFNVDEEKFYDSEVLVDWAKARASYRYDKQTISSSGMGYADHSRSIGWPRDIAHRWIRFRALNGDQHINILAREPRPGKPARGWFWKEGQEREELKRVSIQSRGQRHARKWRVLLNTESYGAWKITGMELLHRSAPVEEQGFIAGFAKALVGNPVTYTFRGRLTNKAGTVREDGLFEVALTSE